MKLATAISRVVVRSGAFGETMASSDPVAPNAKCPRITAGAAHPRDDGPSNEPAVGA